MALPVIAAGLIGKAGLLKGGSILASMASLMATLVFTEGIFRFIDARVGDPEADTKGLLESIQIQNQLAAATSLSAEQRSEERLQRQFSGFNTLASQTLSAATLANSPRQVGYALRQNQEARTTQTDLIGSVSEKLGMTPQDFAKRIHPGRSGDLTALMSSVNKTPEG